jgi:predicted AAA+ superfamily ATPase
LAVSDQYPKYVVTMDEFWKEDVEGVKHLQIQDFLLDDSY